MLARCLFAALLLLPSLTAGCAGEEIGVVRMVLKPRALNPALVDRVAIAAVGKLAQSSTSCVTAVGTQVCADLSSVASAEQATGYVTSREITRAKGDAMTTFESLPPGRTCFVAEAFDTGGTSLASGCAEVDIRLETHRIEIEISSP